MVNSTIKVPEDGSLITVEFVGDDRYSLHWFLDRLKKRGKKSGETALASGGYSQSMVTIHGELVSNLDIANESADLQLWKRLRVLGTTYTNKDVVAYMDLVLQQGTLKLVGWMEDFVADRDAPEGSVLIPVTIQFAIQTVDFSGLS